MGKPFKSELLKLKDTYEWALNLNLDLLQRAILGIDSPIYFVGSGGSLSACYYGVELAASQGVFAKAITPLELYSLKNTIKNSAVIFISASGKNSDILFGFKTAVRYDANLIISICMQTDSKLAELSRKYSISEIYEFSLPVGKDGFLATNSLIAYFAILHKVYNSSQDKLRYPNESCLKEIEEFSKSLSAHTSISVLYNGYSKPVAYDIESKSVEAALYPIMLSDYRNFGHGRHHWYDKKRETAAIICLATPSDKFLAEKTMEILPNNIPKLLLQSNNNSSLDSLELLMQSFYLIDKFGDTLEIDPGRPGVPPFGRKLYNLKYATALTNSEKISGLSTKAQTAISRKIKKPISSLKKEEVKMWSEEYDKFLKKLNKANFGAVIFDYDGTICSTQRKFEGPDSLMTKMLKTIVENGFYIGVVTGRGKSVRRDFQNILSKKYWSQVMIGYYNGSDIGLLDDDNLPNTDLKNDIALESVYNLLIEKKGLEIECTLRPKQLTIEFSDENYFLDIKETIIQVVKSSGQKNIEILESSHSIDIIPTDIAKTDIFSPMNKILKANKLPTDMLCIGDKGKWPGNDYKLLDTSYSLSVYEVNNNKHNCWNIADQGITNTDATLQYLSWLKFDPMKMKIKVNK